MSTEVAGASDAPAPDEGVIFSIQLMGGEVLRVQAHPSCRVTELKKAFLAVKPCPPSKVVKLMSGATILKDTDPLEGLEATALTAVFTAPELSYLAEKDSAIKLFSEGDTDFDEAMVKKAQVGQDQWVPPPADYPGCRNLAAMSEGASVSASSNIWGRGAAAEEKLKNVLRLGSIHGNPRFVGGDNSFIFAEGQQLQALTLDLGRECMVVRIGTMGSGDRWVSKFAVRTQARGSEELKDWGMQVGGTEESLDWGCKDIVRGWDALPHGGVVWFDRPPTLVRTVRMVFESGHYHGAGTRAGPIFVYGWAAGEAEKEKGRDEAEGSAGADA